MKTMSVLFLAGVLFCAGCGESRRDSSDFDAEYEKRTLAQMDAYDRQTKRVDQLQASQEEQLRRFDTILAKWEEQARRLDSILDTLEKQQGIKK